MKKIAILSAAAVFLFAAMAGNVLAARSGGTFNFCAPYGGDLFGLDPHRSTRTQDHLVAMNIHRSLFKWDADKNKPVPALADKMEVSGDGLVCKITLKKNVKFHNGRVLTADDVIWSYERIMSPKVASPSARFIRVIKGAHDVEEGKAEKIAGLRKIDNATLEITLDKPIDLSYPLCESATAILPREEVEKKGTGFGSEPVGCGPFRFVKWVKGSEVVLERFPDYYEKGKPYLDKVVYKIMGEGAARDIAFRAKELDATIVGSAQYPVYKEDPQVSKNMIEVAEMYTRLIGFNPEYKPFANKLVRQAINYAIDSRLIIKKLLKEKAFPCVSYLPTTSPAFDPKAKGYEYNLAKAKELMKKAGYEEGFTFECMTTSSEAYGVPVVEAVMSFLKQINITVKPLQMEGATLAERARKGDYQAVIWSLESGADPLQTLRRFDSRNSRTAGNYFLYNNPEFDKLLDGAAQERDEAKKMAFLRKADAIFLDDAPIWFFNYNKAVIAFHPWVHGIKPVAVEMMYQDLADVWVEGSSPRATEK
jgi:peptide/nickel transport system substrate-binding protein